MGSFSTSDLLKEEVYEAVIDCGSNNNRPEMYRIVDESGEDYLYPPMLFEIVEE